MGEDAADAAADLLRREHGVESGDCFTEHLPLPGAPEGDWESFRSEVRARGAALGLGTATSDHLSKAYGTGAMEVLDAVQGDPALGDPILPPLPYLWAEVPHVLAHEMPLSLEDVLQRRLHLLLEAEDGGMEVAPRIAALMAADPAIAWDAATTAAQLEGYRRSVEASRPS